MGVWVGTGAWPRRFTAVGGGSVVEVCRLGRREKEFELGVEMLLSRVLASPQFIYRIEEEPASVAAGQTYRISEIDLASRLSFFLWSAPPDETLLTAAQQGRLTDPAGLEQQVKRMLANPKARALTVHFAGPWLNLRGLDSVAPVASL